MNFLLEAESQGTHITHMGTWELRDSGQEIKPARLQIVTTLGTSFFWCQSSRICILIMIKGCSTDKPCLLRTLLLSMLPSIVLSLLAFGICCLSLPSGCASSRHHMSIQNSKEGRRWHQTYLNSSSRNQKHSPNCPQQLSIYISLSRKCQQPLPSFTKVQK